MHLTVLPPPGAGGTPDEDRARAVLRPALPSLRRLVRILGTGAGLTLFQSAYFAAVEATGLAVGTVVTAWSGACPHCRRCVADHGGAARQRWARPVTGALAGLAVLVLGGQGADVRPLGVAPALLAASGYAGITLLTRWLGRHGAGGDALAPSARAFGTGAVGPLPMAAVEGSCRTRPEPPRCRGSWPTWRLRRPRSPMRSTSRVRR